ACADHVGLGPATLLLYDVTTLYFETDAGDGFREPGFSKERRLEPQITVGLLTDGSGFPLMVHAFEGNRAETTTMVPVLRAFLDAHRLTDVTVVADAGMVSEANKRAIEDAGLSFILGARVPDVPYLVKAWRDTHPDIEIPDGHIFTQPWPAGPSDKRRDHTYFYQYRADRARRTLRGIDQQITKAENAVAGRTPVKRNRYVRLTGATKTVNRALETKNRALAGIKGYLTNLPNPEPEQVIGAYSRLLQVEKSFRMSKTDLAARPIFHHTRESIEAHLTIVFAALAVSRWIENTTGWTIKRFVTTTRRYRTIQIQAGERTITAADPVPDDLQAALDTTHGTH
ncbi:MAG: IS1634 family transposase, partial [Acidimicrobiales bacterium]